MNMFDVMNHTLQVLDLASSGRHKRVEQDERLWHCIQCGWLGIPSYTDASAVRFNRELGCVEIHRTHVPICPLCSGEAVQS